MFTQVYRPEFFDEAENNSGLSLQWIIAVVCFISVGGFLIHLYFENREETNRVAPISRNPSPGVQQPVNLLTENKPNGKK